MVAATLNDLKASSAVATEVTQADWTAQTTAFTEVKGGRTHHCQDIWFGSARPHLLSSKHMWLQRTLIVGLLLWSPTTPRMLLVAFRQVSRQSLPRSSFSAPVDHQSANHSNMCLNMALVSLRVGRRTNSGDVSFLDFGPWHTK